MSKNFELLQKIGSDEELFRTAVQSEDAAAVQEIEPDPASDQEAFEGIIEMASVAGLFEPANEPRQQTPTAGSEMSPDKGLEDAARKALSDSSADTFGNSSPMGELGKYEESPVRPGAANDGSLPKYHSRSRKLEESPRAVREETFAGAKRRGQLQVFQKFSWSFSWLDSIKKTVSGWEWKDRTHSDHDGADLAAITREEEIKLVQRVFSGTAEDSPRVALFTGLENEARCAVTSARAAEILAARSEGPVCIVDANFQRPSLHEYFGVQNLTGLAEAVVESGPIQNFAQQIPEPDLWFIPSGKASAQLRFPAMADSLRVRIEELRQTFRYVVIHSGPLRLETSAMLLTRWTDGVVLVVEANATRRDAVRRIKEILDSAKVSVLGVVLNNRTFPIPEAIYRRL
jgi:Mrp family chromosome partitioning ATPase